MSRSAVSANLRSRSRRAAGQEAFRQLTGIQSDEQIISSSDSEEDDYMSDSDDEQDTPAEVPIDWTIVEPGHDTRFHEVPDFLGATGLNPQINVPSEIEDNLSFFLDLFFPETTFETLTKWTNTRMWCFYVQECDEESLQNSKLFIENNEMKKFFGMVFLMAINKKPEINHYWSQNSLYQQDIFACRESLSRDRFKHILKFIRFADYDNLNENDSISKVRPFLEIVQNLCKGVYTPQREICVDESLMLYKGRLGLRQYIPNKRNRYGIKTYVACESESGYTFNILSHQFRAELNDVVNHVPGAENLLQSEKIVIYLIDFLLNQGFHVFIDNYYTSCQLAKFLLQNGTMCTGTIRKGRGVPTLLSRLEVPVKQFRCARQEDVLLVKFVDRKASGKKEIYLLDTSSVAEGEDHRRIVRGGHEDTVHRPTVIKKYNTNMGGVDQKDASIKPYDATRKSYKWCVKYGIHLFQILHHNAWVIYRKCGGNKAYLPFIEATIDLWILKTGDGRSRRSASRGQICIGLPDHRLERLPPKENQRHPAKRCRICTRDKKRKETVFVCVGCPGQPGLCVGQCFKRYHEKS